MPDRHPTFSTSIRLMRQRVQYRIEDRWLEFNIQDIQVIGEYTAPPGMLASDYFFSFKLRGQAEVLDVPGYTEGLFETLAELRGQLPGIGMPKLQMSVDFASNVLYPAHVAGMSMYAFKQVQKPLIDLPLLRSVGSVQTVLKSLNPEVLAAVF
jgi:hypothetical protein